MKVITVMSMARGIKLGDKHMGCFNCVGCDCPEPMTDLNGNKALLDEIERLEKLRQETANALYDLRCEAGCGPEDAGPDVWTQLATAQAEAADLSKRRESANAAWAEREDLLESSIADLRAQLGAARQYLAEMHERLNAECLRATLEADCEDGTCRACVKCHDARERERDAARRFGKECEDATERQIVRWQEACSERDEWKVMASQMERANIANLKALEKAEIERDVAVSAAAIQNKACAEEMLAREHMQVNWDTMVASVKQHYEAQLDAEADNRRLRREVEAWRVFESHSQDALCPLCDDYGLCPTFSTRGKP